ncbi:hypothetical protein Bbelb_317860 [Branchiostoma belcheri]|nr:hypothetical protein Bbelb_317860 [Branchiostoma belcheri]
MDRRQYLKAFRTILNHDAAMRDCKGFCKMVQNRLERKKTDEKTYEDITDGRQYKIKELKDPNNMSLLMNTDGVKVFCRTTKERTATQLKADKPNIVSIHSVAHRLVVGQAGDCVKYIGDTFKPNLMTLYLY